MSIKLHTYDMFIKLFFLNDHKIIKVLFGLTGTQKGGVFLNLMINIYVSDIHIFDLI